MMLSSNRPACSLSSYARMHAATAARPIQCPEPSSEMANPQPPARALSPLEFRPYAMDPVPAITITPGPLPNAASMAITMSPTTSISPERISESNRRTTAAISGRAPPAIPTQVLSTRAKLTLAAAQACRMAAARLSRAWRSPTRTTLLPADVPAPNTEVSSPTTQEVLLPPPSMPRKMLTSVVLSQGRLV